MASALPRGITRKKDIYVIEVRYRGHCARAIEPTLFMAEIRKGQLLDDLISERPTGVPSPDFGVRRWTIEHAYDRTSEMIWRHARDASHTMRYARYAVAHFGRYTLVRSITPHQIDH